MHKLFLPVIFGVLLMISSCDDIIERKLTDQTVNILAPADSTVLPSAQVTFWWDQIKGATKYNIQVVKPAFNNIQYLLLDSLVASNEFIYSLQPGNYQWRVKAINNSSQTNFSTHSFSIDSSLNLGNQNVILIAPGNNHLSNQLSQTFSWSPTFYATDYRFEILSAVGSSVYLNAALTTTTATYTFATDGTYTWRVRAQNSSSVSPYTQATLIIDNTVPPLPVQTSPANAATVSNPFTLTWSQTTDLGAGIFDSLYIFANANQDTLIKARRSITGSYSDSLALGDYFWKLRAIDSAGNYSNYTSLSKFVIQ